MKSLLISLAILVPLAACKTDDVATPVELQTIATLNEQEAAALAAGDEAGAAAAASQRGALETSIAERAVGGVIDTIDAFVPVPLQPWRNQLAGLGALLLFKRPRKHIVAGVKQLAKADFKDFGKSTLKAVGLLHSEGSPVSVLQVAAASARKAGDTDLADAIDALIAQKAASVTPTA